MRQEANPLWRRRGSSHVGYASLFETEEGGDMRIVCQFVLIIALVASAPWVLGQADGDRGVAIDSVLNEIQRGLTQAQLEIADNKLPPLESVTVTLQTEYVKSGGPKLKLFIISFGQTWEKQSSNELTLVLKPPPPKKATEAVGTHEGLSDQLVDAIVSAANGVQGAKDRKPPLLLDSMKAEFGFVVNTKTSGGIKFEIVPVTAELSGELSKKAVHKISVSFANPKAATSTSTPPKPQKH